MIREGLQSHVSAPKATPLQRGVSIIIPAYNEENGIEKSIDAVDAALRPSKWDYEIIVVDDGSRDQTAERALTRQVRVVRLDSNRGYGAALKAGVAESRFDWVVIIDADGTYPSSEIPRMLERIPTTDMVVGARIGWKVSEPLLRRPAKWMLRKFASYLVGTNIPDLNSGLRVIRKSLVMQFSHILPPGFSFTTTITLALLSCGYSVSYVPIDYYKRLGRSKIKPSHAVTFAVLILRTMMLFQPMRILAPLATVLTGIGLAKMAYDFEPWHVPGMDTVLLSQALFVWCMALIADQNARFHRTNR